MDRKNYGEIRSPLKAIKIFCVDECNCGNYKYAKDCVDPKCPLYAFRLGKNPFKVKREYSAEEKVLIAERLRKARERVSLND